MQCRAFWSHWISSTAQPCAHLELAPRQLSAVQLRRSAHCILGHRKLHEAEAAVGAALAAPDQEGVLHRPHLCEKLLQLRIVHRRIHAPHKHGAGVQLLAAAALRHGCLPAGAPALLLVQSHKLRFAWLCCC